MKNYKIMYYKIEIFKKTILLISNYLKQIKLKINKILKKMHIQKLA